MAETIHCPLCGYDLRGLSEPRCPECGYAFHWPDLLDPARRKHSYLFEHHPHRNAWSFARTMLGGLRPRRFWSSLKPSQPSRPGRLAVYWLLAALLLPVGYAGAFVYTAVTYVRGHEVNRAMQLAWAKRYVATYGLDETGSRIQSLGPQGWVDDVSPPPASPRYLAYVYDRFFRVHVWHSSQVGQHLEAALVLVAWPWLTLATLMIFRASMRRAKVHTVHVLRCVLYCGDATAWLGAVAMLAVPWAVRAADLGRYTGFRDVAVAAPLFALMTAWRLSAAYRHYLQFDHPAATAAASQVVVTLVVWVVIYTGMM